MTALLGQLIHAPSHILRAAPAPMCVPCLQLALMRSRIRALDRSHYLGQRIQWPSRATGHGDPLRTHPHALSGVQPQRLPAPTIAGHPLDALFVSHRVTPAAPIAVWSQTHTFAVHTRHSC